ncbi:MAG TPA: hypothetical protein VF188_05165 [Longimicrobiales bacterium]
MKRLILNLVGTTVIAVGALYLTTPDPAVAATAAVPLAEACDPGEASCTEGDIELCGDKCEVNDAGHCSCD